MKNLLILLFFISTFSFSQTTGTSNFDPMPVKQKGTWRSFYRSSYKPSEAKAYTAASNYRFNEIYDRTIPCRIFSKLTKNAALSSKTIEQSLKVNGFQFVDKVHQSDLTLSYELNVSPIEGTFRYINPNNVAEQAEFKVFDYGIVFYPTKKDSHKLDDHLIKIAAKQAAVSDDQGVTEELMYQVKHLKCGVKLDQTLKTKMRD